MHFLINIVDEFPAPPGSAYPGQAGYDRDGRPYGQSGGRPGQGTDQRQGLLCFSCWQNTTICSVVKSEILFVIVIGLFEEVIYWPQLSLLHV